jgi:hypothetical protein
MDKRDLLYILLFFATAVMAAWVLHDAIALVNWCPANHGSEFANCDLSMPLKQKPRPPAAGAKGFSEVGLPEIATILPQVGAAG